MADESSTDSRKDSKSDNNVESLSEEETFNYDDILEYLGQMGKFQLHTFLWLCLPALFPGIIVMSFTFTGGIPDYRCYVEGCDDFIVESAEINPFTPDWLNNTIPWNADTNSPDQCNRFNYTWTNLDECQNGLIGLERVEQCNQWVYDQSQFKSTIVSEFDLACEDEWKQTLASTVYMFGMLIGAATLGNIADRIGRRLAFTVNVFLVATFTTSLAFSPNLVTFCILRFLCGVTAVGHFLILFVWGVEAVGKKYRVVVGFIYQLVFTVGSAILGLVAYYVRDWKTLQLIISVPMFALVGLYWVVPESIRWLITKKRYSEAHDLILKVATINKKNVPKHLLVIPNYHVSTVTNISVLNENISENIVPEGDDQVKPDNHKKSESIIDVFRSLILFKRLAIMFLAWIAAVMGYYGITFSATNLSENFYLNYELSMLVEFPAYIAGIFVMDKLGRRPTLSGGLILSGLACLITGVVPEESAAVRVTFSMIGKLFISCVMATVYSYTSDLFPTPARSAAVGLCSTSGRIGGILAPIIANAGRKIDPALPFIIFASVNISVGLLCLLLPETNKITLPATVQEAEDMEKYTFSCLQCRKKETEQSVDSNEPVT